MTIRFQNACLTIIILKTLHVMYVMYINPGYPQGTARDTLVPSWVCAKTFQSHVVTYDAVFTINTTIIKPSFSGTFLLSWRCFQMRRTLWVYLGFIKAQLHNSSSSHLTTRGGNHLDNICQQCHEHEYPWVRSEITSALKPPVQARECAWWSPGSTSSSKEFLEASLNNAQK